MDIEKEIWEIVCDSSWHSVNQPVWRAVVKDGASDYITRKTTHNVEYTVRDSMVSSVEAVVDKIIKEYGY